MNFLLIVTLSKTDPAIGGVQLPRAYGEVKHSRFTIDTPGLRKSIIESFLNGISEREQIKPGLSSGFRQLDGLTSGLQPSDLILVAARPSMGKTALALSLARHVGLLLRLPVLIFSLEMSKRALFTRAVCMEARLNSHRLRGANLSREEWVRVTTA